MRYKHRGHIHSPTTGVALKPEKLEALLYGEPIAVTLMKAQHAEQEKERGLRAAFKQQQEAARLALHIQKKEEEAMSSLRESLERALAEKDERAARLQATMDDWGDEEPVNEKPTTKETPVTFTETTTQAPAPTLHVSVSQQTFEHVKANPGITTRQAVIDLAAMGLNAASTTSLISQMVRTGMCKREDQQLYMQVKYYRPIQMIKKAKSKRDVVRIITRPRPQEEAPAVTAPAPAGIASLASKPDVTYNIKSLLDNISVNEARALYLELKTMFGGN